MDNVTHHQMTAKLFFGFAITSEVKMHLAGSHAWKSALAAPEDGDLVEVRYQDRHYVGVYCMKKSIQTKELKKVQEDIEDKLGIYCPNLPSSAYKFAVFLQLFIQ